MLAYGELAAATAARAAAKAAEAAMHAASDTPESAGLAAHHAAEAAEAAASVRSLSAFADTTNVYRVHSPRGFLSGARQKEARVHPTLLISFASAFGGGIDQKRGGKSAADEDVATFVDVLIFNWLIGGTDAHAKNYSILIGAGGLVRLAPLYDVASILAYPDIDPKNAKLAMKIGGHYRLRDIGPVEWRKLAAELRLDTEAVSERARAMAESLPDNLSTEIRSAEEDGHSSEACQRVSRKGEGMFAAPLSRCHSREDAS